MFKAIPLLIGLILCTSVPHGLAGNIEISGEEVNGKNGLVSQVPGSAANFMFFGAEDNLTDFTVTPSEDTALFENPKLTAKIKAPGEGVEPISTGALLAKDADGVWLYEARNIASFTLSNKSAAFDYSNFSVYVLYSNAPGLSHKQVDEIRLASGPDASGNGGAVVSVMDDNGSLDIVNGVAESGADNSALYTHAKVVKFHVRGATVGDTFTLGVLSNNKGQGPAYLGGISFESNTAPKAPKAPSKAK